jgi:hypothetical protein
MDPLVRAKSGPPDDTPFMPWYDGDYSIGFVALHPFFTVAGLDPDNCEYGTLIIFRSAIPAGTGLLEWGDQEAARRRAGKEVDAETLDAWIKRSGNPIGWRQMSQRAGFVDHCELDLALRTNIGGLRHDLADAPLGHRLTSYCKEHEIFPPTEGHFQPVMQSSLATLFRRAGFSKVIVGDEFGEHEQLVDIRLLEREDPWEEIAELQSINIKRLIAPDHSLLAWVHWDSFYTAIFGTEASLRQTAISDLFEGFWCSSATSTYWLTEACIPLVPQASDR